MTARRRRTIGLGAIVITAALAVTQASANTIGTAPAHELGQSYMFLRVHPDSIVVRLEVTAVDLERALGFGWDPDAITPEQVREHLEAIRGYLEPRFALSANGARLDTRFADFDIRYVDFADFVMLRYLIDTGEDPPDELEVRFTAFFDMSTDHRNMLVIEHNWLTGTFENESNVSLVFSPRDPTGTLDLTSGTVLRGFLYMVWLGVWHIWIGIDHILFLIALILPSVLVREDGRWRPVRSFRQAFVNIATIVTFFTIAHTVTLSLAALDVLRFPSRLVESVIAASIAAAAWANLAPRLRIREWSIAFFFGLFHGFGFASVLGGVGLGREFMLLSLVGFNVGVELGQLAVVATLFPLAFLLRRTRIYLHILRFGSMLLIAVALLWLAERVFDFNVPLIPLARAPFEWLAGLLSGGA